MSDTYAYRSAHNSSFLTLRVIQLVVYYQRCVLISLRKHPFLLALRRWGRFARLRSDWLSYY